MKINQRTNYKCGWILGCWWVGRAKVKQRMNGEWEKKGLVSFMFSVSGWIVLITLKPPTWRGQWSESSRSSCKDRCAIIIQRARATVSRYNMLQNQCNRFILWWYNNSKQEQKDTQELREQWNQRHEKGTTTKRNTANAEGGGLWPVMYSRGYYTHNNHNIWRHLHFTREKRTKKDTISFPIEPFPCIYIHLNIYNWYCHSIIIPYIAVLIYYIIIFLCNTQGHVFL